MHDVSADATDGRTSAVDWRGIEGSPQFRQLVASRKRFVVAALGFALAATVLFVVLGSVAPGVMGASLAGDITLGFVYGVGLIVMTWVITLLYLRKSDREWSPLERRAIEGAGAAAGDDGQPRRQEPVR
jgi:uncharacterized membrane protein (DUF485 family)